jgi:hypothetical protein
MGCSKLKRDVLAQLMEHETAARLGPVVIAGRKIDLYGWRAPPDLVAIRDAIAIPVDLLSLGMYLWDAVPEDLAGIRDVIAERRTFLRAVPVAADLADVAIELVVWRLVDDNWGVKETIDDARARALVDQVALGLIGRDVAAVEAEVSEALGVWHDEIPRLWQAGRRIDDRVYQHVRVLETALAACHMIRCEKDAARVAYSSIFGANAVNVSGAHQAQEAMRGKLVGLLHDAAGWRR